MKSERKHDVWKDVEQGVGSIGRLRILRVMIERPRETLTKYALGKQTKLKPIDVRANLRALIELGWITEHPYEPRTYGINLENEVVRKISMFFRDLDRPSEPPPPRGTSDHK